MATRVTEIRIKMLQVIVSLRKVMYWKGKQKIKRDKALRLHCVKEKKKNPSIHMNGSSEHFHFCFNKVCIY